MNPWNSPSGPRPTPSPGDERHAGLREQLGAYALGQLVEGERAVLDDHLRGCPSCRGEIDAIAPLAVALTRVDPDDLDESHDPPAPAPDHFPAILRRINAERADRAGSAPEDTGTERRGAGPNATTGPAGPSSGGGEVVAFRTRPRPPLRSRLLVAAAGLVIALAGVSAGVALAPDAAEVSVETVAVQTLTPGVDARVGVVGHTWGVELKLVATGFAPGQTYQAAILDDTGRPVDAGAFVGTGEAEMRCNLTSSVLREQASGFVITDAAGTPVLISQFA